MTTAADAATSAVIAAVSAQTGVPGDEILGRRLRASTVEARFLVVYLLRVDYAMTLDRIGRLLDRDPSTVLSAVRQTQRRLRLETHLVETLDGIRAALRAEDPSKHGDEDPSRPATSAGGPYPPPPRGMLRRGPRRGPGVNRRRSRRRRLVVLIVVLGAVLAAGAVRSRSAGTPSSGPAASSTEGAALRPPPSRPNAATSPEAPAGPTTTTTYPRSATSRPAVTATTNAPAPAPTSPPVATLEELAARPPPSRTTTTKAPRRSTRWIPAVEHWRVLVSEHFKPRDVETALRIIQCESRGDPEAKNPASSARGLFQHLERYWGPTWRGDKIRGGNRAARAGVGDADIFDPVASTIVAAWLRYKAGGWTHWTCY